jgi:excisionase family DNA binding protein
MSAHNAHARLAVSVPDEFVELVAERAAALVRELAPSASGWLGVEQAAEYIGCPKSRIYRLVHLGRIPHEHEGARLLFNRGELDKWIRDGGAS